MANKKTSREAKELAHRLHADAIHLLRALRRQDGASGLSGPRLSALSVIVFGGPLTLGELAAAEQVRPPTMTKIVNALSRKGLVAKKKSATDGRNTNLSGTARGRKLLRAARERRIRSLAAHLTALSRPEQATLRRASALLEATIRQIPA